MILDHSCLRQFDPVEYQGQAHQDRFVLHMMAGKVGRYLEIGAAEPKTINNSWALEQLGWTGFSLDKDSSNVGEWRRTRKNPLIVTDATSYNYPRESRIDYLQVDIDPPENTFRALCRALASGTRFSLITFETDAYRDPRFVVPSRDLLQKEGYRLVRPDVLSCYGPFEDWWVDPEVIDSNRLQTF